MSHDPDFDFSSIGRQVKDTVQSAIHSQDFSDIKQTISSTAHEIQAAFKNSWQEPARDQAGAQNQAASPAPPRPWPTDPPRPVDFPRPAAAERPAPPPAPQPVKIRSKLKVPGGAAGVLLTVFGGIGLGMFMLCALTGGLYLVTSAPAHELPGVFGALVFFALMTFISIILLAVGGALRRRVRTYRRYVEQLGDCSFCPVELLASHTGQSKKDVVRDLKRMIRMGLLPDAHLDDEETCVMMNYETYRYYVEAKRRQTQEKNAPAPDPDGPAAVIAEGRALLGQIRACNDALPGVEISAKLTQLDTTAAAIFHYVEEHPGKLPEIRRFLNYYLPTTLKLLEAYRKFNAQPLESEQQTETKNQIESALDTINQAFVRLLDSLMQAERMDVSADISVMKTMMEQEGLAGSPVAGPQPEPKEE